MFSKREGALYPGINETKLSIPDVKKNILLFFYIYLFSSFKNKVFSSESVINTNAVVGKQKQPGDRLWEEEKVQHVGPCRQEVQTTP